MQLTTPMVWTVGFFFFRTYVIKASIPPNNCEVVSKKFGYGGAYTISIDNVSCYLLDGQYRITFHVGDFL